MRIILMLILGLSCSRSRIEITNEYIINGNWDENANAIRIKQLKLKQDSIINPLSNLTQEELLNKLVDDSSFLFTANVKYNGETYSNRKVYFNKFNGFHWYTHLGKTKTEKIGNLKVGQWYAVSKLATHPSFWYIFVDSSQAVHSFNVNLANW